MSERAYLSGGPARGPSGAPEPERGLAVLIVSYRRIDLLADCLDTVRGHLPDARVLVWDNTGPDAPGLAGLVAAHPDVEWELSPVNVGFAAAVNRLAERAGDDDLLLLNPDALLDSPLSAARRALREPGVAAVAGRVAAPDGVDVAAGGREWDVAHRGPSLLRALVAYAGYAPRWRGRAFSDLYAVAPQDVEGYLTGACLLINRSAWTAVGPFDEEFFLYGEEADWQQRARRAGWRLRFVDEPAARHAGHGTVAGDPAARQRSGDLLRAHIALTLEHHRGVHRADAFLAGTSVLDRVQRSRRRQRLTARARPHRPAVVLTINRLVFGGAERHHVLLAGELHRRGHEVTIVCMQRLGPLVREVEPGVRVVRQPWWAPALELPAGPAVLVSGDTNTETGFAALWRRSGRERRWLLAAHIPPRPTGPTYGRALAAAMRGADAFVALSPRHWAEVSAHQSVGSRHFVAPNGVLADSPALAGVRNRPRRDGRPLQLAMLARMVEHKNPHVLVEALAGLPELDWELSIHGDGPDRARLEALTPDAVRDRVHWRGWSPGPDEALADCDLLCVPSRSEAFPLVIVEAMARAVPVMASAVCSVPDMLDDGRAGVLVERADVVSWRAALATTLRVASDDPALLPALGRAGLARMRAHYTLEDMADAYERAIDAVLDETPPAGGG